MGVFPGNDSSIPLSIGQGINPITLEPKGQAVKDFPLISQTGNGNGGQTTEFRYLEITSVSQLREALDVSGSFSFKSLNSASGRINFSKRINQNNQSRYLMVHTRVTNELELADLDQLVFRESVQDFLRNPENSASDFENKFGTEFVSGRRTGGQFYAVIEFEFSSREEEKEFSSALSGGGFSFGASINVNQKLSAFNQTARNRVFMLKEGGSPGLPEINNAVGYALKFDEIVEGLRGNPVTLELITKDYSGVEPINLGRNPQLLIKQQRVMEQLAKNQDEAIRLLNSIRYIRRYLTEYNYNPNIHNLDNWEEALTKFVNVTDDAAVSCFEDVSNNCKLPENISLPLVNLPEHVPHIGRLWLEEEYDWKGRWLRRENTNIFDATWSCPTEINVTAELKVTRNGDTVIVERSKSSDGNNCNYQGAVGNDNRTVNGDYTCDRGGGTWKATIN